MANRPAALWPNGEVGELTRELADQEQVAITFGVIVGLSTGRTSALTVARQALWEGARSERFGVAAAIAIAFNEQMRVAVDVVSSFRGMGAIAQYSEI